MQNERGTPRGGARTGDHVPMERSTSEETCLQFKDDITSFAADRSKPVPTVRAAPSNTAVHTMD